MIKKLLAILLTVIIATPVVGVLCNIEKEVKAEGYYPMSCNAFEVSYINDDGSLSVVSNGCYGTFNEAKARMKTNVDYVVRHNDSLSPSKIIAMNSGFAYTYPARSGSLTMNLYQDADVHGVYGKTTYLPNHYEMTYKDTPFVLTNTPGYNSGYGIIKIVMNDFEGYADLENTDLVPMKYIKNHLPIYLGGNDTTSQHEQPFKVYPMQNFYYIDNGDLVFSYYRSYSSCGGDAENTRLRIGAAPSFMTEGHNYYSNDGVNFYNDRDLSSYAGTNYNYYQFLPLRSKSSITGGELDAYLNSIVDNSAMKGHGQDFVNAQNNYGVNALLLYAMALHESGNGNSSLAWNYNNLFGWGAYDSDVASAKHYGSISECVAAQAGDNLSNYLDITDWRFFGSFLGDRGSGFNVKYASDPYWGLKIAATAYRIDKSVGLRDYGNYNLALVTTMDAPVKQQANSGSKTYYTTGYGDNYQKNFIAIALNQENGYTKVQSTNPISNGNVITPHTLEGGTLATYDYNQSVGFINNSQLTYLNGAKPVVIGDYIHGNEAISLNNGVLSITGQAYRENLTPSGTNVSTTLTLVGKKGSKTVNLTSTLNNDVITYSGNVDVSNLNEGTYTLRINTTYSGYNYDDSYFIEINNNYVNSEINNKLISLGNLKGKTTLNVKDNVEGLYTVNRYIKNLTFDTNGLTINGFGAIDGVYMGDNSKVKHQIVLQNQTNENDVLVFDCTNTENSYALNDGLNYKYSGFNVNIPINQIPEGNYIVMLKITVDDLYTATRKLTTTEDSHNISFKNGNNTYRLSINQTYGYRMELSNESTPIDYSEIYKGTMRESLNYFKVLNIDDKANLTFGGAGMIYYHNYDTIDKAKYKLIFVKDGTHSFSVNGTTEKSPIDFKAILASIYNLDYIYFTASQDLDALNLEDGNYKIFIELSFEEGGKNYKDYIELQNSNDKPMCAAVTYKNRTYTFKKSSLKDQIYLEVKTVNE